MAISDEIKWVKQTFGAKLRAAVAGSPLTVDLLVAIAVQETGELFSKMRKSLPVDEVLRLCVGDTLDAPNRSAFPKNKSALVAVPRGDEMFELAHDLLGEMADATGIQAYKNAAAKPNKFVHGYGIFQYDLQFFKADPDYFLNQKWKSFDASLAKAMSELKKAAKQLGYLEKTSLTDLELAFVAIVYNTGFGNFDQDLGLKQGFFDGSKFYGQHIASFMATSKAIPMPEVEAVAWAAGLESAAAAPYYPHWAVRDGTLTDAILQALPANAILGVHHHKSSIAELRKLLKFPGKRFQIAWYVESNLDEESEDDLTENRVPIAKRIAQARDKQDKLIDSGVAADRFANLVELDAARDKAEGDLPQIAGNRRDDAVRDARAVLAAGFKYHAKNFSPALLARVRSALRSEFGNDTVPRIVLEDVTGSADDPNPGYHDDAVELMRLGETLTLVVHEGAFGGFPGASLAKAKTVVARDFDAGNVEVWFGRTDMTAMHLGTFGAPGQEEVADLQASAFGGGRFRVSARPDLNLRGGPGGTFNVVDTLDTGRELAVLAFVDGTGGRWAQVDLVGDGNSDGFVFAAFLRPV